MGREKKKTGIALTRPNVWDKHEWTFAGSMSNLSGGFDMFELGSVRRVQRKIKREDFAERFSSDIASMLSLNSGQQIVLKCMMENKAFYETFEWTDKLKIELCEASGLKPQTVEDYFRTFCGPKKILKRMAMRSYRMNTELVFSPAEVKNADFLGFNLVYIFDDSEKEVVQERPKKITLDMINNLIEAFNKQESMQKKITELDKEKNIEP